MAFVLVIGYQELNHGMSGIRMKLHGSHFSQPIRKEPIVAELQIDLLLFFYSSESILGDNITELAYLKELCQTYRVAEKRVFSLVENLSFRCRFDHRIFTTHNHVSKQPWIKELTNSRYGKILLQINCTNPADYCLTGGCHMDVINPIFT